MVATGKIEKLAKGKYYKPQCTVFGELLPEQNQIVNLRRIMYRFQKQFYQLL